MKANLHKNMWKVQILTGKYPAKTFAYKILSMKHEVLSLFHILDKVTFSGINNEKVVKQLLQHSHIIDVIYEKVISINKITNKKVNITYEINNKFKFDILSDGNLITIKIPIED